MLYSPFDEVVDSKETELQFQKLGSEIKKLVPIKETKEHILCGDIVNPKMNEKVFVLISDFLNKEVGILP